MKNPKQRIRISIKHLRIWTAWLAVIALLLSFSGCGGGGTSVNGFSGNNPVINVIQPTSGSTAGGTVVTFFGANFQSGVTASFGGAPSTSVVFIGPAQITAVTPAHLAGSVDVVVTNPGGASATITGGFTYNPPPSITTVSPNVGSINGGTAVTIVGTVFLTGATVTFGTASASNVIVVSQTQITATTPAHAAGTVSITVTNLDGSTAILNAGFTYGLPPSITNVSPSSGPSIGGTIVTITGAEFQPGATVTFGGLLATGVIVSSDATTIQATTPAHAAGAVDVTVTNPDGRSTTLKSGFTYTVFLTITSIVPNSGPIAGGTAVILTGTNFQPGATVTFAGQAACTNLVVVSTTQITCTTTAHAAGRVDVTVLNFDNSSFTLTGGYTYTVPVGTNPTIVSISPPSGTTAGGITVTIIGTNFHASATVTFGGVSATIISITPDGTQITLTTPSNPAGPVDVTVTNQDDKSTVTQTGGFTYTNPPPTVASVFPTSGPTTGGKMITITGSGFIATPTVALGGVAATGVILVSSTQITALTPAHGAATVDVLVTNPDLQSADLPSSFTFLLTGGNLITTTTVAVGNPTAPYYATLLVAGGTPPYTWSAGPLPTGLSFNTSTGVISGTPTTNGTTNVTFVVTDSSAPPIVSAQTIPITIEAPPLAALPQVFLDTTFPDTTNYTVLPVAAGGDFQAALNNASCSPNGTVIRLASNATYSKSSGFVLPLKACAPGQWIIIRTDIADTSLPAADTRIDPTYSPILAKIFTTINGPAAISTVSNANHYWFMGVEIGASSSVTQNFGIFTVGNGETDPTKVPDHIYVDRCYIHGNAAGDIQRGFTMNGAFLASVNSYYENLHYVGTDSQAIAAWNGPGPLKVVNNFLEGAAENILWGGAKPTILNNIQSDVEIRRNHFFKPLTWKQDDPSYAGIHWTIKNLLEFKSAQRVLVEGNVLEHDWVDAQVGYGVLFTPRGQKGTCPLCTAADIVVRYNIYRHSTSGFNIAGEDNTTPSAPSQRVNIHDNLMTDINGPNWSGGNVDGKLYQLDNGGSGTNLLPPHDITINHNTGFQSGNFLTVGSDQSQQMPNIVFTNNIQPHNTYGLVGTGTSTGNPTIKAYFTANAIVTNNLIDGLPNSIKPSQYPAGNFFPPDFSTQNVGFVDFAGGDFRLAQACLICVPAVKASPFLTSGTDGRDMGADVSAVNSATAGVIPANEP